MSEQAQKTSGEDTEVREDEDAESKKGNEGRIKYAVTRVINAIFNLDLLAEANEGLSKGDLYTISLTTFSVGGFGLTIWSMLVTVGFGLQYLLSSQNVLDGINRFLQIGPLVPVALFIFAIASNWSIERLQRSISEGNSSRENRTKRVSVFLASLVAFVSAFAFRWSIFNAALETFGRKLSTAEVIALVFLDGVYISLLLIGIGGLASLILEPDEESN